MSSSRFSVSPRMLEPFLNPFLEGKPKIMDGASRNSAVVKRSSFLHLQAGLNPGLIYILFSAGSKFPLAVLDEGTINYLTHDNGEFEYQYSQCYNFPTKVGVEGIGFGFSAFNKSEISRWRTVCSGLKIENTSALDASAGYFEAIRIDEKIASRHLGFQKNFETNGKGDGYVVIDESFLKESASFDKSAASYITGPLTEIGKILFALKPLRDYHPFQDIPEVFTFGYGKEGNENNKYKVDGALVNTPPPPAPASQTRINRYFHWDNFDELYNYSNSVNSVSKLSIMNSLSTVDQFIDTQIDQTFDKILIILHPGANTELTLKTATYQEICYRPSSTFQRYETTSYENPYQRHALRSVANQLIKAGHSFRYKLDPYSFAGKIQRGSLRNLPGNVASGDYVSGTDSKYLAREKSRKRSILQSLGSSNRVTRAPRASTIDMSPVTREIARLSNLIGRYSDQAALAAQPTSPVQAGFNFLTPLFGSPAVETTGSTRSGQSFRELGP